MLIKFINLDENIHITESIIREVSTDYYGGETHRKETHFQALLVGKNVSNNKIVHCLFKYYDEENNFLGLNKEEQPIKDKEPFTLSIMVSVPDNTFKTEVYLQVNIHYEKYMGWFGNIVLFILFFLGLNAFFN